MANKSFSIFNNDGDQPLEQGDKLLLEIGKLHVACLHIRQQSPKISAFELFSFAEGEMDNATGLFDSIASQSQLLGKPFVATSVFINNQFCFPVPSVKFSNDIGADYLNMVFGGEKNMQVHHENVSVLPDVVMLYRVPLNLLQLLQNRFQLVNIQHNWTNVLNALGAKGLLGAENLLYVQFYSHSFLLVVVKNNQFQLIQTFDYETPEDVLYHLLNVAARFDLPSAELDLRVNGLIDPNYKLFRELAHYFKSIVSDKADFSNIAININEYPRHYFTPFFNLAL